jgi:peptide/nickel transport system substrate-binding protein
MGFKVDEYVADSHVILSRNPFYREKDKPYLDQIILRFIPSSDVAMQLLRSGEVDIMWNNTEADIPQLERMPGIVISAPTLIGGERLVLNLAEDKDPADPNKPHLILSDQRVRQAIAYGINKQRIIDSLLFGKSKPGTTDLNAGPYSCPDIMPYPYDPQKAKALLTDAGWILGSDGIRVAKGAKTAPDGTRLRLKYSTTSGNKLREDTQVLVVEDMKTIGVELFIENAPPAVILGTWDSGSPLFRGNYDIIERGANADIDPHIFLYNRFHSKNITSAANMGGLNVMRYSNSAVDKLIDMAGVEPDGEKRKLLYCQAAKIIYDQAPIIYLYTRANINSYRDRLQGWIDNSWDNLGWDSAGWWWK